MRVQALIDRGDFAAAASFSETQFMNYAGAGLLPACIGIYNGQPLWLRSAVDEWLKEQGISAEAAAAPTAVRIESPPPGASPEPPAAETERSTEAVPPRATMTVEQVCQRLGTVPATLKRRRDLGLNPRFEQHGRSILYVAEDVESIYREHGKLPRHYSADGLASIQANSAKARAARLASAPRSVSTIYPLSSGPAKPLAEPKPVTQTEKVVVKNCMDEDEAAHHLGIPLLMLRILRKAQLGPAIAREEPLGYRMSDLNDYVQRNSLQPGQISRSDKAELDKRVRVPVAAGILRMSPKALEHHRAKGTGPAWERQGIFSVYKTGDLFAYLVHKDELAEQAASEQRARAH